MSRDRRIVAELGRPETPEETAARKAAASKRHRMRAPETQPSPTWSET